MGFAGSARSEMVDLYFVRVQARPLSRCLLSLGSGFGTPTSGGFLSANTVMGGLVVGRAWVLVEVGRRRVR